MIKSRLLICFPYFLGTLAFADPDTELLISQDPIGAAETFKTLPDSDDKFAKLYLAEQEIAVRSRGEFFYCGYVYPTGQNSLKPNRFETYVMRNKTHFRSSCKAEPLRANDFWLKRLADKEAPAMATYQYHQIKGEQDNLIISGTREDGKRIFAEWRQWLEKYPKHPFVTKARLNLETLQKRSQADYGWTL